jgi:hypothetical protein
MDHSEIGWHLMLNALRQLEASCDFFRDEKNKHQTLTLEYSYTFSLVVVSIDKLSILNA